MSKKIKMGKSHPPLVPHWMVTFSDMRTVLLCFFVLLAGFSGSSKGDYGKGPGSLAGGAGIVGDIAPGERQRHRASRTTPAAASR